MQEKNLLRTAHLAAIAIVLILATGFFCLDKTERDVAAPATVPAPAMSGFAPSQPAVTPTLAASTSPAPTPPTNRLFLTADRRWQQPLAEEAFARFHDWAERYIAADASAKVALEAEGIALAETRREALASLIKTNPERALELAAPLSVRRALPLTVQRLLEERVSGRGTLAVLGVLAEPGQENQLAPTIRTAQFGTRELNAFVSGRRLGEPTRANIPLNGIAVDNSFAVNENPVRVLEPVEAAE